MITTKQASILAGVSESTAKKWAGKNGVQSINSGFAKTYIWTESDVERLKNRNTKRGRPSKSNNKEII